VKVVDSSGGGGNVTFTSLLENTEYTLDQSSNFTLENQNTFSEGIFTLQITVDDKAGNIVTKNVSLWMTTGNP